MNGEDLANKAGLNRTNRFIFSDSYYEKMPEVPGRPTFDPVVPPKKEQDLSKEVMDVEKQLLSQANYSSSVPSNNVSNDISELRAPVQQASSLDQVLQNDYSNVTPSTPANGFDFFSHQTNTVVNDSDSNTSENDFNSMDSVVQDVHVPMQKENFFDTFSTQKKPEHDFDIDQSKEEQISTFGLDNDQSPSDGGTFPSVSDVDQVSDYQSAFKDDFRLDSNMTNSNIDSTTVGGFPDREIGSVDLEQASISDDSSVNQIDKQGSAVGIGDIGPYSSNISSEPVTFNESSNREIGSVDLEQTSISDDSSVNQIDKQGSAVGIGDIGPYSSNIPSEPVTFNESSNREIGSSSVDLEQASISDDSSVNQIDKQGSAVGIGDIGPYSSNISSEPVTFDESSNREIGSVDSEQASMPDSSNVNQINTTEDDAVDVYDFGERPVNSSRSTKKHILYSNDGKGSFEYSLGTLKLGDDDQFDVFDIHRDSKKVENDSTNSTGNHSVDAVSNDKKGEDPLSNTSSIDNNRLSDLNTQENLGSDYTFGVSSNPFVDIEKAKMPIFSSKRASLASIEKELAKGDETVDFIQKLKDQEDAILETESNSTSSSFDPSFGTPVQEKKDFLWEAKKETPIEEIKIPEKKLEYDSNFGAPVVPEEKKFIVNGDPSVEIDPTPRKMDATKIPDFMSGTIRTNDLNIETGVNQELEAELLRKRDEEEEQRRLENSEYLAYQSLTARMPTQKMVYKAGGKSYVRDVVEKPKLASALELASNDAASPQLLEESKDSLKEESTIDYSSPDGPKSIEELIEGIVGVPGLYNLEVKLNPFENPGVKFGFKEKEDKKVILDDQPTTVYDEKKDNFDYDQNFDNVEVVKSTLLDELIESSRKEGRISVLARYGEDFCARDYITNPAIGRADEIKQLILILLTPEKSGILIGKPGIGKTSIVEGLAYQLQRNNVPDALKGYRIVSVKTSSLLGSLPTGETRLQTLVDELKELDKIILFIDEIHMLVGATSESALDFANMFKESLGRGSIKVIGATTTEEYERYILRDKAFVRRFQKVEVEEPNREQTIKILLGTLPKIEKVTGAKLKYTEFMQSEIMSFIVDITTEYKRVYGIGSRYPDICLTLLSQAFSQAVFANRQEVTIQDIRKAIENSKNIYPDVIRKELVNFDRKFRDLIQEEELGK